METTYYKDNWNLYQAPKLKDKIKVLKKYFVVDAGQLIIGLIGLAIMLLTM